MAGTSKGSVFEEGGVARATNKPDSVAYRSLLTLTRAVAWHDGWGTPDWSGLGNGGKQEATNYKSGHGGKGRGAIV